MKIIDLPNELQRYIFDFAYGKCDKCKKYIHFEELTNRCRIFQYKSVFDVDYYIDDSESFNLICKNCIKEYKGKVIINLNSNTYSWIE